MFWHIPDVWAQKNWGQSYLSLLSKQEALQDSRNDTGVDIETGDIKDKFVFWYSFEKCSPLCLQQ